MRKGLIQFGFFLLAMFLAGCASTKASSLGDTYDNPAENIVVTPRCTSFTIVQNDNPKTGYSWKVRFFDSTLLRLVSQEYQPAVQPTQGFGGKMVWVFEATPLAMERFNKTEITLVYAKQYRPTVNPQIVVFNVAFQPKQCYTWP